MRTMWPAGPWSAAQRTASPGAQHRVRLHDLHAAARLEQVWHHLAACVAAVAPAAGGAVSVCSSGVAIGGSAAIHGRRQHFDEAHLEGLQHVGVAQAQAADKRNAAVNSNTCGTWRGGACHAPRPALRPAVPAHLSSGSSRRRAPPPSSLHPSWTRALYRSLGSSPTRVSTIFTATFVPFQRPAHADAGRQTSWARGRAGHARRPAWYPAPLCPRS